MPRLAAKVLREGASCKFTKEGEVALRVRKVTTVVVMHFGIEPQGNDGFGVKLGSALLSEPSLLFHRQTDVVTNLPNA